MSKDNEKEIESSYVIEITKETQEVRESEEPTKVKKIIQTETITQSNENDGDSKDSERSSGAGMRNKYKKKKGTSDSNNNLDNLESSIKNNTIENETKIIEDDKELKQSIIDGVKNKKIGKFNKSQNEEGSVAKTEITIIKTEEITEEQNNISNPSANLKSNKPRDSKGGMTVSKVTEISSSSNQENKEGGKKDQGLLDINNSTNKEEKSEEKDNKIDVQTNDSIGLFGKKRKRERERERERKSNDSTNEPERSKQIITKTNDSDDTNPGKQRFRKRKSNDSTNEPDGSRQIISKTNDSNDINPGKQRLRERKSNDSTNDPKGSKSFRTLTNDSNDTTPGKKGQRDRRTNDVTKDSNKPNEGRRGFNNKDDKEKNRNNPDSSKEKIISQIYIRKTGLNSNRDIETPRIGNERDTNSNVQNNSNLNQGRPGQRGIRPSEKSSQSNLNDRSGRRDNNPSQNISKERTSKNEQNPFQNKSKERPSKNEQNPYQNPFQRNREPDDKQKASNRRQPNQIVSYTNKGFKQENPRDSARSNNRNNPNVSKDKDKPYGQRITKITEVRTSTNDPNQGGRRPNPKDSNRSINQSNPNVSKDKDKTITQRITKITEVKTTINIQNQGGRRGNPRDSDRPNNQNKPNDKLMYNQKQTFNNPFVSTPNIRDKNGRRTANEKPQNRLNSKDNKKNIPPLYNRQNTDTDIPRNNTVRHLIDETGKIPKKEYVLNVRKLDTIKDTKRHKQTYNDSITGDDKPISSNFNHNMIVVKNVTKEYKTVADVDYEPIKHRYNYSFVPGLPNTYVHTIDESGKNPKKQKEVSPRKNQIIRTERKPSKLVYTMSEYKIGERIPYNDNSNSNNNNNNNLRNRKNLNEPRGGNRNQNTLDANNNRKRPNQIMSGRMTPGNDKNNQRNNRNRNDGSNARNKSELGKRENSRDVYKKQVSSKLDTSKNNASNRRVTQEYSKTIETTSNRTGKDFLKSNRNKDDSRKGQRGEQSSKIEIIIEKKSIIVDEENDSSNRRKKRNSAGSVKKDDKSSKFQITSSTRNMEVRSKDDSANGPAKKLRRYKKI